MDASVLIVGAGADGVGDGSAMAEQAGSAISDLAGKAGGAGGGVAERWRCGRREARTLEFYRQLEIAEEVVAGGIEVTRLFLREESREIAEVSFGGLGKGIRPYPFVLSFPQDDHESGCWCGY